jgi:hypothetical protein
MYLFSKHVQKRSPSEDVVKLPYSCYGPSPRNIVRLDRDDRRQQYDADLRGVIGMLDYDKLESLSDGSNFKIRGQDVSSLTPAR